VPAVPRKRPTRALPLGSVPRVQRAVTALLLIGGWVVLALAVCAGWFLLRCGGWGGPR
jgi:hypothetical protein